MVLATSQIAPCLKVQIAACMKEINDDFLTVMDKIVLVHNNQEKMTKLLKEAGIMLDDTSAPIGPNDTFSDAVFKSPTFPVANVTH